MGVDRTDEYATQLGDDFFDALWDALNDKRDSGQDTPGFDFVDIDQPGPLDWYFKCYCVDNHGRHWYIEGYDGVSKGGGIDKITLEHDPKSDFDAISEIIRRKNEV